MPTCESHDACIEDALNTAEQLCREKGLRFTALRREVLSLIWRSHGPAKAYDILAQLAGGAAQPPTVYRSLEFLQDHGLVHKVASLSAYVGCGHPLSHADCYFLICGQCGEIEECCGDDLSRAISKIATRHDFQPRHATLEIEGTCRDCQDVH